MSTVRKLNRWWNKEIEELLSKTMAISYNLIVGKMMKMLLRR